MEALKSTSLATGLLFFFLTQTPSVLAHLPELYGRKYIRVEEGHDGVLPEPAASQLPVPSRDDRAQHEQLLDEAELSGGPYAAGLTDPLINLGSYYEQRGETENAIEAYRRALHLVRINDGLTSRLQIPILRQMMDLYRSVGDYTSLGEAYQYYYRVGALGEPPRTKNGLDARVEYLMWERELYAFRSDGKERAHLLQAYRANAQLLESLTPTTDLELDWYLRLAMSQMRNLYLILGDDPMSSSAFSGNSGQGMAIDRINKEVGVIQKLAFHKGKKLLEGCIDQAQSLPPAELAALHLELGDWYQWNGSLRRAGEQYARVVEVLRAAGEQQLLKGWLDEPKELPDERDLWPATYGPDTSPQVVVTARYRVNSRGDVSRVEASVSDEADSRQAARIRRMLRDTHFRPRFSSGLPEAVDQVSRRYRLIDAH